MRSFIVFFLILWMATPIFSHSHPKDSTTVYIFMHNDCVITQNYTLLLNQLHETYSNETLQFVGIFPDFSSKPDQIEAFRKKYRIAFDLKTDYYKTLTKKYKATITPEVIVVRHRDEAILYRGRIDNMYYKVGRKRTITTTSELKDALEAIRNNQPITNPVTTAVGCFINFKRGPQAN
ncbi:MAG: hypothetical protein AAF798_22660 [Bacteroidota bacterium]